ncbi:MAG: thermonuclease family protein [Thermomicrobiales bacterium]
MPFQPQVSIGNWRTQWAQGTLATMLGLVLILCVFSRHGGAQEHPERWTDPTGVLSVEWEAPWEPLRIETDFLAVGNGLSVVGTYQILPVGDINPTLCLQAFVQSSLPAKSAVAPPIAMGRTSWRAYATYYNIDAGLLDYFECQITPDGESIALFVASTTLSAAETELPAITDFLGQWVVRSEGEGPPALADAGWRAAVIEWTRGRLFADLGLQAAPGGNEYLVVIADLRNWQASEASLPASRFAILDPVTGELASLLEPESATAAGLIGESPFSAGALDIEPGASVRTALVFLLESGTKTPYLTMGQARLALIDDGQTARFGVLPPSADSPATESGAITGITDGRSLRVELDSTGVNERVRLIGLADPADDAAKSRLESFIGQPVILESDPGVPDGARLHRYVWVAQSGGPPVLLNALMVEERLAEVDPEQANARFGAMMTAAQPLAPAGPTAEDPGEDLASETPALTDAEREYVNAMVKQNELIALAFQNYDAYMAAPTLDDAFYNRMILIFQGWSIAYNGVAEVTPPPTFADLHARYLALLEPFDSLAHQLLPEMDQWFAGEVDALQLVGFDVEVVSSYVAAARFALESVMTEIDLIATSA